LTKKSYLDRGKGKRLQATESIQQEKTIQQQKKLERGEEGGNEFVWGTSFFGQLKGERANEHEKNSKGGGRPEGKKNLASWTLTTNC